MLGEKEKLSMNSSGFCTSKIKSLEKKGFRRLANVPVMSKRVRLGETPRTERAVSKLPRGPTREAARPQSGMMHLGLRAVSIFPRLLGPCVAGRAGAAHQSCRP